MNSVCLATYNGERYIKQQVTSILMQLNSDDEIIVSDDHSTDNTLLILNEFDDKRIKIFINNKHRSVTSNFENSLSRASGDFIFLSDQDDVWVHNKVEICIKELQNVSLLVTDCFVINGNSDIIENSFFESYNSAAGIVKNFIKNTYLGNCMAFRKEVLDEVLPFPTGLHELNRFYIYHDIWIGLIANAKFRVSFLPEKLSYFRRHERNVSPTDSVKKSPNTLLKKIQARAILAYTLLQYFYKK